LGLKPKHIEIFADIQTLIIDEADMLLDGGYIRQLENVLLGFKRADRLDPAFGATKTQHVFCAATLPDMGLRSVDAYLQRKFPYSEQIQMEGMHNAKHYGLAQSTVWKEIETKKERMELLQEILQISPEEGGLKGEKLMLFVNSVEDVEGAHEALERAGVSSVPFHAKIKLGERSKNLDRFRRYNKDEPDAEDTVPVLVCTDLASRGLDVPGVNVVVQLQFAGNVVSHLHRMGRCGRAGQRTGRGIVFYNSVEAQLVEVLIQAEEQQERMVLEGDVMDSPDSEGDEVGVANAKGKVKKAFSRKRGFTKKIKKQRREARSEQALE
jgi:superfamily II DNA/RNA helicase